MRLATVIAYDRLEIFAVIADLLDDAIDPAIIDA